MTKEEKQSHAVAAISAAAHSEVERLSHLIRLHLPDLDPEVAAQALETFESAESAALWLMDKDHRLLRSKSPLEVSRFPEGKAKILNILRAIEHGIPL